MYRTIDELSGADEDEIGDMLDKIEYFTKVNIRYLNRFPDTIPLYKSPVIYEWIPWTLGPRGPKRPMDVWRDIPSAILARKANCKDFVAWRLAELRRMGIAAKPRVLVKKFRDGRILFHAVIEWPNGEVEDPSLAKGMSPNLNLS